MMTVASFLAEEWRQLVAKLDQDLAEPLDEKNRLELQALRETAAKRLARYESTAGKPELLKAVGE